MSTLTWSESMRGRVSFDATDYNEGWWHGTPCCLLDRRARRRRRALLRRRPARGDVHRLHRLRRPRRAHGDRAGHVQPARRGWRAPQTRDALPALRARPRRARGHARRLQERRGQLVSRHLGRHDDALRASVLRLGLARGAGRGDAAGHRRAARVAARLHPARGRDARTAGRQVALRRVLQPLAAAGLPRAAVGDGADRLPGPARRSRRMARLPVPAGAAAPDRRRAHRGRPRPHRAPHPRRRRADGGPRAAAAWHRRARRALLRRADAALDRRRARRGRLRRLGGQLARIDRPSGVQLHARRGRPL